MKKIIIILTAIVLTNSVKAQKNEAKDERPYIISEQSHDTLEIKDTSIHYIKIGDEIFEVVRKVELKKAEPAPKWADRLIYYDNKDSWFRFENHK